MNKDQSLGRMIYYMEQHVKRPENLDEYIDYSMYVQAEGLKFACEHFRRRFPQTAGALIWQLNDCMPVHSWSMIDYDLVPKASYYYAVRFFAPAAISLEEIDDSLTGVWVLNNTPKDLHETVKLEVKDFFGNVFYSEELKADVPANTVTKVKELRVGGRYYPNVIVPNRHRMFYVSARGEGLGEQIRFFGNLKEISFPPAKLEAKRTGDTITIRTDNFARFVKIDGDLRGLELSDNYFDLEPGQAKTVTVRGDADRLYAKALNSHIVFL
jgi:beta-mannosidase